MSKRKLNRRQAWRIQKIQEERAARASKKERQSQDELEGGDLGPEQLGLVIAHYGTQVAVEAIDENGKTLSDHSVTRCHMRANLGSLVTGDRVVWRSGESHGVIVAVDARHSELSRPDPYGDMKTVAANIDRIIIVIAPYPEPHANLIDRYLVAAESLGIEPIILLNKIDRIDATNKALIGSMEELYTSLGYDWLNISTLNQTGCEDLTSYLSNYTSVFVGQSGVGKSSLINMLLPSANLKVGELSEVKQKGTHTTTTAELFHFPYGGHLIDSPGIREFGLWHMDKQQLLEGFKEFRDYLGHCKFRDCSHEHEPGCALVEAYEQGKITQARMSSYKHILNSLDDMQ